LAIVVRRTTLCVASRLADLDPVRGTVTRTFEACGKHEGLGYEWLNSIVRLPVSRDAVGRSGQNVRREVLDFYVRRNEKAIVVYYSVAKFRFRDTELVEQLIARLKAPR
jgi:hypothetical protein